MPVLSGSGRNQSLARAFAVLEHLAGHPDGLPVAALSRELGLPRATVTRLLASLADQGAVARTGADRRWVLGPTIVRLARAVAPAPALPERARPLLEAASRALGETVLLAVPVGHASAQVIEEVAGPKLVGVGSWAGRTVSSPASGFVRMLLAELDDDDLRRTLARLPLEPLTASTITDPARLLAAVQEIRREGASLVVDEYETGLSGMAVPVRRSGRLVAMVAVYLPTARFDDGMRTASRERLAELAQQLESVLAAD